MMTALPALTSSPLDSPAQGAEAPRPEPADSSVRPSFREALDERRTPANSPETAASVDEEPPAAAIADDGPVPADETASEPGNSAPPSDQPSDEGQPPAADGASGTPPPDAAAAQQPVIKAQGLPAAMDTVPVPAPEPAAPAGDAQATDGNAGDAGAASHRAVQNAETAPPPPDAPPAQTAEPRDQVRPAPVQRAPETQAEQGGPASQRTLRPAEPAAAAPQRPGDGPAKPMSGAPQTAVPVARAQDPTPRQSAADDPNSGDRGRQRSSDRPVNVQRTEAPMAPAAARAMQVEAAVRLENLTGQAPSSDASARLAGPTLAMNGSPSGVPALNGGAVESGSGAPAPPSILNEGDFSSRIVRGLSAMINQRGGVMNMRLQPPELGELRVQMSITQGTVSAQFTAATEQAQTLLDRSLTVLRAALESHGLTVERLAVHLTSAEQSNTARNEANSQQHAQQQSDQHNAAGGESRGRHDGEPDPGRFGREAPADFAASLDAIDASVPSFAEASLTGGEPS